MSLRITVEDLETGEKGERIVEDGDYCLVTAEPCYLDGTQMYARSHVLTIRGLKNGLPALKAASGGA